MYNGNTWAPQPQSNQGQMYFAGTPVAPVSPSANSPKKSKVLIIVLIIEIVLIAVSAVALVLILNNKQGDKTGGGGKVASEELISKRTVGPDVKFEDLTKEQALEYYIREYKEPFVIPDGYVGQEVLDAYTIVDGNLYVNDLRLAYSYENLNELKKIALERYNGYGISGNPKVTEDDLEITEYDYYAIVVSKNTKGFKSCDHADYEDCDRLLSFKKQYLDYERVERKEDGATYVNDVMQIMTRDADIVDYLMRVSTFFYSNGWSTGPGTVYSYSFEETDKEYLLTLDLIGVGMNLEKYASSGDLSSYAVNLYRRRFSTLKENGYIGTKNFSSDSSTETVRSMPLDDQEMERLKRY